MTLMSQGQKRMLVLPANCTPRAKRYHRAMWRHTGAIFTPG